MTQFASTLYPQTNPTNPILLALREPGLNREAYIRGFFIAEPWNYNWPRWNSQHIDHARRVLTRLASLSG